MFVSSLPCPALGRKAVDTRYHRHVHRGYAQIEHIHDRQRPATVWSRPWRRGEPNSGLIRKRSRLLGGASVRRPERESPCSYGRRLGPCAPIPANRKCLVAQERPTRPSDDRSEETARNFARQ